MLSAGKRDPMDAIQHFAPDDLARYRANPIAFIPEDIQKSGIAAGVNHSAVNEYLDRLIECLHRGGKSPEE